MNVEKPESSQPSQEEMDRIQASRTISDAGLLEKGASFKDGKMVGVDQENPTHEMHMETVKGYKKLHERRVICQKLIGWSRSLNKNEMYVPDKIDEVRDVLLSLREGLDEIGAVYADKIWLAMSDRIERGEYLNHPLEKRAGAVGAHELYSVLLSYEEALYNATEILLED